MTLLVPFYQSLPDSHYEGIRNKENQSGKLRLLSFGDTYEAYKTTWLGTHGLYQSQTFRRWSDSTTKEGLVMKFHLERHSRTKNYIFYVDTGYTHRCLRK